MSGRWCVDQDSAGDLAAAVELRSTGTQTSESMVTETDGIGVSRLSADEFPFLVGLKAIKRNGDETRLFSWRQGVSEGINIQDCERQTSTVPEAQFNLQKLASSPTGSTGDLLYRWLETTYLERGMFKFQIRRRREDLPEDLGRHEIREGLRQKILEGEPKDWQSKLQVDVDRKEARLKGTLTVGPRLLRFLTVAPRYYAVIFAENSGHPAHNKIKAFPAYSSILLRSQWPIPTVCQPVADNAIGLLHPPGGSPRAISRHCRTYWYLSGFRPMSCPCWLRTRTKSPA